MELYNTVRLKRKCKAIIKHKNIQTNHGSFFSMKKKKKFGIFMWIDKS